MWWMPRALPEPALQPDNRVFYNPEDITASPRLDARDPTASPGSVYSAALY
jgi:hypothetical protein